MPVIGLAQSDFETKYLKINATSLPEISDLTTYSLISTTKFSEKIPSFKMNQENYRIPVNMSDAINQEQTYAQSNINIKLDPKEYGVYGGNSSYNSDSSTRVRNTVYEESRSPFIMNNFSPYRLNPYRAPHRIYGSFGIYG